MNFIKKIDDSGTEVAKLKSDGENSGKSSKLDKKPESYLVLPMQKLDPKSPVMDSISMLQIDQTDMLSPRELTQSAMKDIDILKCLHNEIVTCECCINKSGTPSSHPRSADIFHLTSTNEDNPLKSFINDERTTNTAVEAEQKPDLREILLNNYDPKFAAKIGIRDFLPIEVMNNHLDEDSKPLEFIPFENIDHSYPK